MLAKTNIFNASSTPTAPPPTAANDPDYKPFGAQADYAFQQGWRPETNNAGQVTYRNMYNKGFNNVQLSNGKGHLALIGNGNGTFDVVIRDENNKMQGNPIMKGQSYKTVDDYFRNANSVLQQRVTRLGQGQENSTILAYKK